MLAQIITAVISAWLRCKLPANEHWAKSPGAYRIAVIGARNVRLSALLRMLQAVRHLNPTDSIQDDDAAAGAEKLADEGTEPKQVLGLDYDPDFDDRDM